MTINEAITILHAVVAEDPSVMVHEAWQTLKSLVLAKQTNNISVMPCPGTDKCRNTDRCNDCSRVATISDMFQART